MVLSALYLLVLVFDTIRANPGSVIDLDSEQKQQLVDSHNKWRINTGAAAMLKVTWNDAIAKYAENAASRCVFNHTLSKDRHNVPGYDDYVGENIYMGGNEPPMQHAVNVWGQEIKDYDLKKNKLSHYTQVVWAKTSEIGCGMAKCDRILNGKGGHCLGGRPGYLLFCNYGPGGNYKGEKPYEEGKLGSKCEEIFKLPRNSDGLCAKA